MNWTSPEFLTALTTAFASIAAAVVSVIKAVQASKRAEKARQLLDDAKARSTYSICPECGKKIYLSDLSFHLPSGQLDDDLNGIPDDEKEGD